MAVLSKSKELSKQQKVDAFTSILNLYKTKKTGIRGLVQICKMYYSKDNFFALVKDFTDSTSCEVCVLSSFNDPEYLTYNSLEEAISEFSHKSLIY